MATVYRTIMRPIITERSSAAYQDRGEYTFEVAPDANKYSIKAAVEQLITTNADDKTLILTLQAFAKVCDVFPAELQAMTQSSQERKPFQAI